MDFYFYPPEKKNWGSIYLSRLPVAELGSQILKVKSCLLFLGPNQQVLPKGEFWWYVPSVAESDSLNSDNRMS